MGLQTNSITFTVSKDLRGVNNTLRQIASQLDAEVERIVNDDPLGGFDSNSDIEVVLSGKKGLFNPQYWAVQVFVDDLGNSCNVELVALGNSTKDRILYGTANANMKMSLSVSKRDEIAAMLSR